MIMCVSKKTDNEGRLIDMRSMNYNKNNNFIILLITQITYYIDNIHVIQRINTLGINASLKWTNVFTVR